jgi:predicted XRE-type DNA-binding protein
MSTTITESSGNVFADLGFEPAEASILEMRAKLMSDLREYIQSTGMTQTEASKKLKIARSRVADLMDGRWEEFSLEMLITLAARVGRKVTLELAA